MEMVGGVGVGRTGTGIEPRRGVGDGSFLGATGVVLKTTVLIGFLFFCSDLQHRVRRLGSS